MRKDDNQTGDSGLLAAAGQPPAFDMQRAMLDATCDCIKVLTPEGVLLAMSAAGCLALGIAQPQVEGTAWIPLLPPAVQAAARQALAKAARGQTARFAGHSQATGQLTHWDNLLTPVVDRDGRICSIVCVSRDVTEQVSLQRELDQALEREKLLSAEMVHRIKNLFTVAAAVMLMADRESRASGSTEQLARIAASKLQALSRAYSTVMEAGDVVNVEMEGFMKSVLQPFGGQCQFSGARHCVPGPLANLLALFLHELATNSVKHGALSVPQGHIKISWVLGDGALGIAWQEQGGPLICAPPARHGYGTKLIDQLAASAGGLIDRDWHRHGLQVGLRLPLHHGQVDR
ncbi:PAS domain-containing protein [Pseudomonas sp. KCJK8993]|uniref:PAS domain-containing protein n=1 Tax=Pseudomonas sp. KCJK8993 TaxID=3344565 RepID=UPI003906A0C9